MDIGEVLRRAWEITWKNKGLWILGILAACTGGGGGGGGSSSYQQSSYQFSGDEWPGLQRFFGNIPEETLVLAAVALALVALLLVVVLFVLGILGQAGLIAGFARADETGTVTLAEAWRLGLPHFWRLLGALAIVLVVGVVLALLVGIPLILLSVVTCGLALLCLIPLAMVANVYITFVQNSIVVEKLPVLTSFRRAWDVLRANLGMVVVVGLILVIGGFIVGLLIAAPLIAIALPAMLAFSVGGEQGIRTGTIVALACGLGYLPGMILLNGILQTYVSGTWTLTYRRLIAKGPVEIASVPSPS